MKLPTPNQIRDLNEVKEEKKKNNWKHELLPQKEN
jgi:hypothetical protein